MEWLIRSARLGVISLLILVMWIPVVQGASRETELVKITVNVSIENPDYFWGYPFLGKKLDGLRVSAIGKSFYLKPNSNGEKIEFEVPRDYKFRLSIGLQNNNVIFKETNYVTKWGVNKTRDTLDIVLKAPEPQSIIITTSTLDETPR